MWEDGSFLQRIKVTLENNLEEEEPNALTGKNVFSKAVKSSLKTPNPLYICKDNQRTGSTEVES